MTEEKVLSQATLCYPMRGNKLLLAKKMKKIGAGFWNGYGGGPEPQDKTIVDTAIRELYEESGLTVLPENLLKIAVADFKNTKSDGETFVCRVHVYLAYAPDGEPNATDEMATPTWFAPDALPFQEMMQADKEWLPMALGGKKILVKAHYGPFQKELLSPVAIEEVERLPEL